MSETLSVLIAAAGRPQLLQRTLHSLAKCVKPRNFGGVVVVENGSRKMLDGIVNLFRADLHTRYLYLPVANKSMALNYGLERIESGSLVFFTDDDVRVSESILADYAEVTAGRDGGQFYGGPMAAEHESAPPSWLFPYLPPSTTNWSLVEEKSNSGQPAALFRGCNWAAFTSDLRAVGGFDPAYGPGAPTGSRGQESEMQRRLLHRGLEQVYVPTAMVWHYVPAARCSARWALKRSYQHGVEWGLRQTYEGPTIVGYPRWMVRHLAAQVVKAVVALATPEPSARFRACYELFRHLGVMRGIRT